MSFMRNCLAFTFSPTKYVSILSPSCRLSSSANFLGNDNALIVYAGLSDMQRLNGWGPEDVSALEIIVDDELRNKTAMKEISDEVGARVLLYTPEDEDTVVASSALNKYPEIFSWLDLIDFNVLFILILMTVVAGFNMISSLLIMLFNGCTCSVHLCVR